MSPGIANRLPLNCLDIRHALRRLGRDHFAIAGRYQGIVLNADIIKQIMFGGTEIDGPPRNTAQIGQPG